MIITKTHLPRRTFLRGVGATLALPLLDGMVPAFTQSRLTAAAPVRRLGIVYVPNGVLMDEWTPDTTGADFELKSVMRSLAPYRTQLTVVSGLANKNGEALPGEGAGEHARAAGAFLTGVHIKKTAGADIRSGISMDQLAARAFEEETQLASLELSLDSKEPLGVCDPGYSCVYGNTLNWLGETTPLPMENNPRVVFERLFGGSGATSAEARLARMHEDRTILDVVSEKLARLRSTLGGRDRAKLDEYTEAIRDVERRIRLAEQQGLTDLSVAMEQPPGIPDTFAEHAKLMYDLQVLAYQADLTRVITFMVAHETSARAYPEIDVSEAHHPLSHHGGDKEKIAKLIDVNSYHVELLSYYLQRLAATEDGDGSLLDHSMIMYGSGMSDGNAHNHSKLPIAVIGGGAGSLKGGRHIRYDDDPPVANLYLSLLGKLGVHPETMGDSTGPLTELTGI
jgi:hypothetical protein